MMAIIQCMEVNIRLLKDTHLIKILNGNQIWVRWWLINLDQVQDKVIKVNLLINLMVVTWDINTWASKQICHLINIHPRCLRLEVCQGRKFR